MLCCAMLFLYGVLMPHPDIEFYMIRESSVLYSVLLRYPDVSCEHVIVVHRLSCAMQPFSARTLEHPVAPVLTTMR